MGSFQMFFLFYRSAINCHNISIIMAWLWQNHGNLWHFCKNNIWKDPIWKPSNEERSVGVLWLWRRSTSSISDCAAGPLNVWPCLEHVVTHRSIQEPTKLLPTTPVCMYIYIYTHIHTYIHIYLFFFEPSWQQPSREHDSSARKYVFPYVSYKNGTLSCQDRAARTSLS